MRSTQSKTKSWAQQNSIQRSKRHTSSKIFLWRWKQMMFNQAFDKSLPRGECVWLKKGPMTGRMPTKR